MRLGQGELLAGYTIDRLLGAGGMGSVYLARHPRMDRLVALKVLNDAFAMQPKARAAFEREAALLSRLDHPNIVAVYDHSATGDEQLWIAMKFIEGTDADELITDVGALPPEQAVDLIAQAARGIDHAHAAGVLHRDIKPANLLVERNSTGTHQVLVTDFGIARSLDDSVSSTNITATFAYAAPERFSDKPIDQRADVYSLGCTLYQFLTGEMPFPRNDPAAVMVAHLNEPPPRPTAVRPGLPQGFDRVIRTAMAKDPANRYQTCQALAEAAQRALASTPSDVGATQPAQRVTAPPDSSTASWSPDTEDVPAPPTRPRRPWLPWTAAASVAAIATIVAFLVIDTRTQSTTATSGAPITTVAPPTAQPVAPEPTPAARTPAPVSAPAAPTSATPTTTPAPTSRPLETTTQPEPPAPIDDLKAKALIECRGYVAPVQQRGMEGTIAFMKGTPTWFLLRPQDQAVIIEAIRLAATGECG
ncbi:protein kinase [Nocardia sp. NPDC052566]|uniref:serine/threonine-protein kinase n=1 Tax=Nocardia sp. NPDC052566 TaxID=3364330 RepID=UPI0037CA07E0